MDKKELAELLDKVDDRYLRESENTTKKENTIAKKIRITINIASVAAAVVFVLFLVNLRNSSKPSPGNDHQNPPVAIEDSTESNRTLVHEETGTINETSVIRPTDNSGLESSTIYETTKESESASSETVSDEEIIYLDKASIYILSYQCGYFFKDIRLPDGIVLIENNDELFAAEAMYGLGYNYYKSYDFNDTIGYNISDTLIENFKQMRNNYPLDDYVYLLQYVETGSGSYVLNVDRLMIDHGNVSFVLDKESQDMVYESVTEDMSGYAYLAAVPRSIYEKYHFVNVIRPGYDDFAEPSDDNGCYKMKGIFIQGAKADYLYCCSLNALAPISLEKLEEPLDREFVNGDRISIDIDRENFEHGERLEPLSAALIYSKSMTLSEAEKIQEEIKKFDDSFGIDNSISWIKADGSFGYPFEWDEVSDNLAVLEIRGMLNPTESELEQASTRDLIKVFRDYRVDCFDRFTSAIEYYVRLTQILKIVYAELMERDDLAEALLELYEESDYLVDGDSQERLYKEQYIVVEELLLATDEVFNKMSSEQREKALELLMEKEEQRLNLAEADPMAIVGRRGFAGYVLIEYLRGEGHSEWYDYIQEKHQECKKLFPSEDFNKSWMGIFDKSY